MNDVNYPPLTDNMDDLPRTLRREREARERDARERGLREPHASAGARHVAPERGYDGHTADVSRGESFPATVTGFKVPFFSLAWFLIKVVLAAIPALLLLLAILYGLGIALKAYFPWIVQTEILIRFPR